ncbi:acyloxyacyl hydrolase [Desulfopila inferna]|uniref:acyloxyacyl hydrolase n=1 Tax=Desulfopila inferna TaxID=468528 RepID=UPI001962C1DC|nr:acyloxyacyl hydrolase [Desulfopila inferna]MBM9604269.1 acyloxyacyl hydrolase [Desulfopila inferna]
MPKKFNLPYLIVLICLFQAMLLSYPQKATAREAENSDTDRWAILTGYGSSHPGWGETETRVETIDLALRRKIVIFEDMGKSWYSGSHSLLIELPLHFLLDYDTPMAGLNFLANYTFSACALHPYVFAGGGPVYVDADIPGMGSDWNGNYQIGFGVQLPMKNDHTFFVEARYHHISNGGIEEPNVPLNSAKFLVGMTF